MLSLARTAALPTVPPIIPPEVPACICPAKEMPAPTPEAAADAVMGGIEIIRRCAALALTFVLLSLSLAGCQKDTPLGRSFRFSLPAEPRQLDPQVAVDAASVVVVSALFEGLTRLDEEGKAVPAAAEWSVSDDGLTYTFHLRKSKWSNGEPVTADDFVFGMQRAVSPETGSDLSERLFGIRRAREINAGQLPAEELGVRAVDDSTLVITLTEADAGFPEKAAGTPFFPCSRQFFESTGGRYGLEAEYLLTNGPFSLDNWAHGQSLRLTKAEGYHEQDDVYPAVVRYIIGGSADSLAALKEGGLDAAELTPEQAAEARDAGMRVVELEDTIQMLWLNNSVKALSSAKIRAALRDGLEWNAIMEQVDRTVYSPAAGYIAPDAVVEGSEKYRVAANAYDFSTNRAAAVEKLAEGLTEKELKTMPRFTVLCADDAYSQRIALYVIQSWQKNLDVYAELQPLSASELTARVAVGNYQIAISSSMAPGTSAMEALGMYTSTASKGNWARFGSEEYDALFTRLQTGGSGREELDQLEEKLMELCPSIPLTFQRRYMGIPAEVSGLIIRPFGGGAYGAPVDFRHAGKTGD